MDLPAETKCIAILTSKGSWFVPYAHDYINILREKGYDSELFSNPKNIGLKYKIVFALSYFEIIPERFLKYHRFLIVHESALPRGKGWAPLFWQILEGRKKIPVVLFEATPEVDAGDIYIRDYIVFRGDELHDEIREKQARKTILLCLHFLNNELKPHKQSGEISYYPKRTPENSELDIDKTISEQFNLLRIVDNKEYPAFFHYKGNSYILKIYKEEKNVFAIADEGYQ